MSDPFVSASSTPQVDDSPVQRDRYGRYMLPSLRDPNGKPVPWTRATTFCKSVADTFGLMQWSNRMVAKGVATRPDLYALASATDVNDKRTMDKLCEDAKNAAGATAAASLGTALHSFTEAVDRGEDPEVPLQWKDDIAAYKSLKEEYALDIPSWAIERIITVEKYGIAGTFDRIIRATKRISFANSDLVIEPGDWVIGDVKTGKDLKYGFNEIAIQLALYAHADAIWNGAEGVYEEMPDVRKDVALVVHLPAGKKRADLYGVDIETGWQGAELCARVREWRKLRGVANLADSDKPSWKDLILQASSREDLSAVWRKASAAGEWTSELEALGKGRLQKLGL